MKGLSYNKNKRTRRSKGLDPCRAHFFLHERLFGGKGHRKEYNSFFTSSDSLKCLTRKTASSTPHLSPQLQLSVNRGQDSSMDILLLLPSKCPGRVDQPHGTGIRHKAQPPKLLHSWLVHLPRKMSQYLKSMQHTESTRHRPNRTS